MTTAAKQFSRALRKARGALTQAQAAACIPHLPLATYQNWEQGHRTPPRYVRKWVMKRVAEVAFDACLPIALVQMFAQNHFPLKPKTK